MSAENLHAVELGRKALMDTLDEIQAFAKNLQHPPRLSGEDTKGLDKIEETLSESVKKTLPVSLVQAKHIACRVSEL
jgi:hypothetical protein